MVVETEGTEASTGRALLVHYSEREIADEKRIVEVTGSGGPNDPLLTGDPGQGGQAAPLRIDTSYQGIPIRSPSTRPACQASSSSTSGPAAVGASSIGHAPSNSASAAGNSDPSR